MEPVSLGFDNIKPRRIRVEIKDFGVVELQLLSWSEWQEIGLSVPEPEPVKKPVVKNGKKEYEVDTQKLAEGQATASGERVLRRLAACLMRAGHLPELQELSLPEAAAQLAEHMDSGLIQALAGAMIDAHNGVKGRLLDQAATFPGPSEHGDEDL